MIHHYYYHLKNLLFGLQHHSYLKENRRKILSTIKSSTRCFIVATGPSINDFDFSLIKKDIIIGVNTLYRGLDRFNIIPTYYLFTDERVFFENDNFKKVLDTGMHVFVSASIYYTILNNINQFSHYNNLYLIKPLGLVTKNRFSRDILKGAYKGHSVIIFALQFAYSLGCKNIYLIGVDYISSDGKHFDGKAYDFKLHESEYPAQHRKVFESYAICDDFYKKGKRQITNLNPNSGLPIFPKKDIREILI